MNWPKASLVVSDTVITAWVVSAFGLKQILKINTDKIGPILHKDTKPKLSSPECLFLLVDAIPAPSAMINGTVIGPVVTPPESKAVGTKVFGTKKARIMIPQ